MKTKTAFLIIALIATTLASCKKDEPLPEHYNGYTFSCVTGADTLPNEIYYFQISLGDTIDSTGTNLIDYDLSLRSSDLGAMPLSYLVNPDTLSIAGKYCIMLAYYSNNGIPAFVNSSFYLLKGNDLLFSECNHNGHCMPFLIVE